MTFLAVAGVVTVGQRIAHVYRQANRRRRWLTLAGPGWSRASTGPAGPVPVGSPTR